MSTVTVKLTAGANQFGLTSFLKYLTNPNGDNSERYFASKLKSRRVLWAWFDVVGLAPPEEWCPSL
jgi:hypothetical protein